jgi:hypothetical protein
MIHPIWLGSATGGDSFEFVWKNVGYSSQGQSAVYNSVTGTVFGITFSEQYVVEINDSTGASITTHNIGKNQYGLEILNGNTGEIIVTQDGLSTQFACANFDSSLTKQWEKKSADGLRTGIASYYHIPTDRVITGSYKNPSGALGSDPMNYLLIDNSTGATTWTNFISGKRPISLVYNGIDAFGLFFVQSTTAFELHKLDGATGASVSSIPISGSGEYARGLILAGGYLHLFMRDATGTYIEKYDTSLSLIWSKQLSTSTTASCSYNIKEDATGFFYLVLRETSLNENTLYKLNSNGTVFATYELHNDPSFATTDVNDIRLGPGSRPDIYLGVRGTENGFYKFKHV